MQKFIQDSAQNSLAPQSNERCLVTSSDLVKDTGRFLDENYRGCYREGKLCGRSESVMLVPDGYAEFLKIIFKSVFAKHLITVSALCDVGSISFKISFDTSKIDTAELERLGRIAEASGFSFDMTECEIVTTFKFLDSTYSAFQAVSSSFIYNTLKKIFFA